MNRRIKTTAWGLLACLLMPVGSVQASDSKEAKDDAIMEFFRGDPDIEFAEPAPLLTNVYDREITSLNGNWEIVIDEPGMSWNYITEGGFVTDQDQPVSGMELIERSFDKSRQLQVPGDWNSQDPTLDRYRGKVVYHKSLPLDKDSDQRYYLHFGGANYMTDLFVNGEHVGRHEGGYTAFNFEVTDHLIDGDNTVIVRVDAFLDDSSIPTMRTSDFWKYGGITRDVNLVALPETHVSQYHVYLSDRERGEIRGWVQLDGDSANEAVTLAIPEAGIELRTKTDKSGRAEFVATADLSLWSPASPKLYDVTIAADDSQVSDRIGFRSIETDGLKILLNGEAIKLHGISMHEETVLRTGVANTRADAEAQFALIKEMGANFVRLSHYPHNEHTVKLADELGLMLWSEVPIVSLIDWTNEHTLKVAKAQIADNVNRDLNRASIIMWSVANETFPKSEPRLEFLKALRSTAKSLDKSDRLIAAALIGNPQEEFTEVIKHLIEVMLTRSELGLVDKAKVGGILLALKAKDTLEGVASSDEITVMIDDPLGEVVDIVGYNEYFGWYYSGLIAKELGVDTLAVREALFAIMPDVRFENSFGKPMIISEFGAGAKKGLYSDKATIWSEEYQAKVYKEQFNMLEKSEYVQGMSPWILKDFRSHLRELNGIQGTYNRKGVVSETGEKKKAFFVMQDYYRKSAEEKVVNLD